MEQNILNQPEVLSVLKKDFLLVRLYTDGGPRAEENQKLELDRFQTLALPFYVTLDANGQILTQHTGITLNSEQFLRFLNP